MHAPRLGAARVAALLTALLAAAPPGVAAALGVFPDSPHSGKKSARLLVLQGAGRIPGDDLLSQDLSSHYHWRWGVSLPGSEWDRVVPPRSGHQRATLVEKGRDSGDVKPALNRLLSHLSGRNLKRTILSGARRAAIASRTRPLPDIHMEIDSNLITTAPPLHHGCLRFLGILIQKQESSRTDD